MLSNLSQTTCLILPAIILRGSDPPYVELLDQLIGQGFTVTGVRLTVLDAPQAHCISEILSRAKCGVAAKVRSLDLHFASFPREEESFDAVLC